MEIKKKIIKFLLLSFVILTVLSFSACTTESFEGEVCELEYKEAYTTTLILPITIFNGKTSSVIMIPYFRHYPNRWRVKVREYDTDSNKYIYHECYVTEETYNSLKIGDWFVYDEDYCYPDEPYSQERA